MKNYDDFLHLWTHRDWIALSSAKGTVIVGRFLADGEYIDVGSEVKFISHSVLIKSCIRSTSIEDSGASGLVPPLVESSSGPLVSKSSEMVDPISAGSGKLLDNIPMVVHESISLGLDFSPGIRFAKEIRKYCYASVHPSRYSGHFIMVVSFGRASFKLHDTSVGIALEAVIGGYCGQLKVSLLND